MSIAPEDTKIDMNVKLIEGSHDDSDEVEIKIEYNESNETDPFCETTPNSVNCGDTTNFRPETYSTKLPTCEEHLEAAQEKSDNSCVSYSSDHNLENNGMDIQSDVTWYKSIDDSERFICKFCDLKYSSTQTLRYHVKTKHPAEAKKLEKELVKRKRKKRLKCHICNKYFKEISSLKDHVQRNHNLLDNFQTCGNANEAEYIHISRFQDSNKKTYFCNICAYRTISKSHYTQHINTHTSDKSMRCRYCDYATNHVHNFKVHERKHTNYKPYLCDFTNCGYQCSSKSALRSHQCKHNPEENMLYCDKCSYKTIYRQCLKRHTDSHRRNSIRLKLL